MASYGYNIIKVVESTQGDMDIGVIDTTSTRYNTFASPPTNFYGFGDIDIIGGWWAENGLLYYASVNPNIMQSPPENLLLIASVGGVNIYACLYVNDPSYPAGHLIVPSMGLNVGIRLFCGDQQGEVTPDNPSGYRLWDQYDFPIWDYVERYEGVSYKASYYTQAAGSLFGFFAVTDGSDELLFCNTPRRTEYERVVVDSSSLEFTTYDNIYHFAAQIELISSTFPWKPTGTFPITALSGERVTTTYLTEKVGTSSAGGGHGTYDIYSDDISLPPMRTIGAANSGLLTMYNPSISGIKSLSNWLWSNNLVDMMEKLYAQPMDLIVSLSILPVIPENLGNDQEVKIGGVGTGINMTKINNQYMRIDCGSINVKEYFGSALDYGTYTKVSIYLPFCNTVNLKTDEVMNGTVTVTYDLDLFSGSCVAYVKIKREGLNSILYSFEGNMAVNLPLISRDYANIYQAIARSSVNMLSSGFSPTTIMDSALNVMSTKPNVNRTGGISANGGFIGLRKPYIIIERPIQSLADGYNKYVGYPSNITASLGTLRGYTEVEEVICDTLKCTKEEQDAIVARLKSGIIL